MSVRPEVAEMIRRWLARGDRGLLAAARLSAAGGPWDCAGYFCEQAAENYLKALLTYRGVQAPMVHDIGYYHDALPSEHRLSVPRADFDYLSTYGIDPWWEPDGAQIERALAIARAVGEKVRAVLPPEIL